MTETLAETELTPKQREALELAALRYSSKEIARELGISPSAVDQRLDSARRVLGASTRIEAARLLVERHGEPAQGRIGPRTTCESLTGEAFPVHSHHHSAARGPGEPADPVFRFGDAAATFYAAPWRGIDRLAPELRPDSLGPGKRLMMIVWGAVGFVILFGLLAAIAMGLSAIV